MLDRVDIDEKWFYMSEVATSYIRSLGRLHLTKHANTRVTSKRLCVSLQWRDRDRIP